MSSTAFARGLRLRRLSRCGDGRFVVVPLDHPVSDGPIMSGDRLDAVVAAVAEGGGDAVVLHKGAVRRVRPERFAGTGLIVHLSASTAQAPDPDAKYLVATVEEALRAGADAVSVHVNLGSLDERRQIADLAAVSDACDRWNLPLLAMVYPRGPRVADPFSPELIAHAALLAAELGADLVKTPYCGDVASMSDVVQACPIPLLTAGGARIADEHELLTQVGDVMRSGAAGVAMGRSIWQSDDPAAVTRAVVRAVRHAPAPHLNLPGLVEITA
ncbi:2-amino-3,7-dideoxy-D-threo-hept-6-ulosonate synthase [Kineosporia succinea]|uniref:2-amino-4, 5-dihydroxy-6-oxo-7-(Phosphonooxy)heptanoate synthase n=1 Tax=Kineosporia succinea TaxID=84632 RepID=A0ABT9NYY8_9ACTN|nr:2-amino-3,7-dideoxy-D-threo-hept-6-ulosonate synthase [Kineosporia succinea]MDP9825050.1 2-amino-4,5-dihydroxy-6-oxo-7-(phosphonooxy)heptanoate synthase [Kineosporia succinea]